MVIGACLPDRRHSLDMISSYAPLATLLHLTFRWLPENPPVTGPSPDVHIETTMTDAEKMDWMPQKSTLPAS
eukprot:m.1160154 g.1160154  ORF g.1160154 m.1160154 type:complete len:72 (-) comp24501_c0_seq66:3063-3278(-)